MKKDTKKIIITILIIVSMFTIFFVSRIFLTKTNDKLPEVKLKKISKKDNMFALMVETEENKYEEYQEEGWPGSDYFYKESKCVDNNGTLVENAISFHEDTKTVELETNQTIYCTLYFDIYKEVEGNYTFYIKENITPKYTKDIENQVKINWEADGVKSYCISEDDSSTNCEWQDVSGKEVNTTYKFKNDINGEKTLYAYLKDNKAIKKVQDKIILDTIVPQITSVRTIYDLWGSTSVVDYNYVQQAGIDGIWTTAATDPQFYFPHVDKIKNITGAFIELGSPATKDMTIELFYTEDGGSYSGEKMVISSFYQTKKKLLLEMPSGNWNSIRYDIGIETGLSYQVKHLGVLATDGQANNDDIILEVKGTVGLSGIKNWQNTYTDGSNWVDTGEKETVSYITYTGTRNQNTYIRLCNNAGVCSSSVSKLIHITN